MGYTIKKVIIMAIFYKEIKGCGPSSTDQTGSTTDLWTYLLWADAAHTFNDETVGQPTSSPDFKFAPKIIVSNAHSSASTGQELGRVITEKAISQFISTAFTFKSSLSLESTLFSNSNLKFTKDEEGINFTNLPSKESSWATIRRKQNVLDIINREDNDTTYAPINIYASLTQFTKGSVHIKTNGLYVGGTNSSELSDGVIVATNKCEALYFNATSDHRAKSNITPAEFSALQVVTSLPTYTFNYNNKEEKTLGLIAQEAAKFDLDGFNMVDNLTATGENGDFMQMKESKLVYVLWKAVQELSAEVEELKTQIASLK